MKQLEALLGLHEPVVAYVVVRTLRRKKYTITEATSVQEMLDSIHQHGAPYYAVYIMDANLGAPGSDSCAAAEQVYAKIKDEVAAGNVKFMSVTSDAGCAEHAQKAGIPCIMKPDIIDYLKTL